MRRGWRGLPEGDMRSGMFMLPLEYTSPEKVHILMENKPFVLVGE